MGVRFVIVAYCVGCLLGLLGLIEWLVSRIAAGRLLTWAASAASLVSRIGRRIPR